MPGTRRAFLLSAVGAALGVQAVPSAVLRSIEAARYVQEGRDHFSRGELEAAIACLSRAIEIDPADEQALDTRSAVYESMENHERAILDRTEIIRLNPDSHNFLMRGIYALGHDQDLAVQDFTETIRQEPQHANAYFYRASAFEDMGQYDLALADYAMNARLDPENADEVADDIARVKRLQRLAKLG